MKQNLLFILICVCGISSIHAQFVTLPAKGFSASPVKRAGLLGAATAGDSLYFGYSGNAITSGVGMGQPAEVSAAIRIPASLAGLYAGKTVSKIRIGLFENCTNVSVWIRDSLAGDDIVAQTVGDAGQGWTEATLSTPYTISSNDFYIGYTATGDAYQIGFSGNAASDGCWLWNSDDGWANYTGQNWGSLCIQAMIGLQGDEVLALRPESMPKSIQSAPGRDMAIRCMVGNYSSVEVTSVKVVCRIGNQAPVEQTISTSIASMKIDSIAIPIDAIASAGIYTLSVNIPEINGQPNPLDTISLNSEIQILEQSFPRKVVMEEGTATGCGECIGGEVSRAAMKEKYPDTFIGIAVHVDDPMAVEVYSDYLMYDFISFLSGSVIDRKLDLIGDPYYVEDYYQSEIGRTPLAGIQLTGGFADTDKKAINLKTATTFGVSADSANFRLAYVLIENGITGYDQQNAYSGTVTDMSGYENKPRVITDMVFNDVARGIYSDPTGIESSLPASITAMTPIEHTFTIDLPDAVIDKDSLEVVVLLLNAVTGEIENADKIAVTDIYNPTALVPPLTDAAKVYVSNRNVCIESNVTETIDIYSVSGMKMYSATKTPGTLTISSDRFPQGIRIVKGSSGWVKKLSF